MSDILGVSYQQVGKYESGADRISAASLDRLARALELPLAHFFVISETDRQELNLNREECRAIEAYRSLSPNVAAAFFNFVATIKPLGITKTE